MLNNTVINVHHEEGKFHKNNENQNNKFVGSVKFEFTMYIQYLILVSVSFGFCSNLNVTLNDFEKILSEFSRYFEFECVSIISDGDTTDSLKTKQFFKTKQVQVVQKKLLGTLIKNVGSKSHCTYFVFAQNQTTLQNLVEEILSTKQNILNFGSWYIVTNEIPEIRVELEFNSDVNIVLKQEDGQFDLLEVYDLGSSERIVRNLARWRTGQGVEVEMENKLERRKNLLGKHFR